MWKEIVCSCTYWIVVTIKHILTTATFQNIIWSDIKVPRQLPFISMTHRHSGIVLHSYFRNRKEHCLTSFLDRPSMLAQYSGLKSDSHQENVCDAGCWLSSGKCNTWWQSSEAKVIETKHVFTNYTQRLISRLSTVYNQASLHFFKWYFNQIRPTFRIIKFLNYLLPLIIMAI